MSKKIQDMIDELLRDKWEEWVVDHTQRIMENCNNKLVLLRNGNSSVFHDKWEECIVHHTQRIMKNCNKSLHR